MVAARTIASDVVTGRAFRLEQDCSGWYQSLVLGEMVCDQYDGKVD